MTRHTPRRPPQDHTSAFSPGESTRFVMEPIAIAHTPYKERFGTPHQATTVRGTREGEPLEATIELLPHVPVEALRSLEGFERVWLIYVFHMNEGWSAMVRPPRGPRPLPGRRDRGYGGPLRRDLRRRGRRARRGRG